LLALKKALEDESDDHMFETSKAGRDRVEKNPFFLCILLGGQNLMKDFKASKFATEKLKELGEGFGLLQSLQKARVGGSFSRFVNSFSHFSRVQRPNPPFSPHAKPFGVL